MDHDFIRFEQLSSEIREEIRQFHEESRGSEMTLEESTQKWFADNFDMWLHRRFPDETDRGNNRQHYRLEIELPVSIVETLIDTRAEDEHSERIVGHAVNISRGGLYFIFERPIERSSIIKIMIDLHSDDGKNNNIEVLAMVVRCDKLDDGYGIGIMFSSIYDRERESIDLFFLKKLALYLYH